MNTTYKTGDLLAVAAAHALPVVRNLPDDRLGARTPCAEYDVRALVNHLFHVVVQFQELAAKRNADFGGDTPDYVAEGDDWAGMPRRRRGATLYVALLAAFEAVLARYTGQSDLVIGSPTTHRPFPELERSVGMFVTTTALRLDLSGDLLVRKLAALRAHGDLTVTASSSPAAPKRCSWTTRTVVSSCPILSSASKYGMPNASFSARLASSPLPSATINRPGAIDATRPPTRSSTR